MLFLFCLKVGGFILMSDNFGWRKWHVVFKLDPDKGVSEERLSRIIQQNPDAVIVGGTQGINGEKTALLADRIMKSGFNGTLVQEISELHAVIPGMDGYIIPVVLNAGDRKWLIGAHLEAVKTFGEIIDWEKILPVGYIVCNPLSAVAAKTLAEPVSAADAAAYAALAANIYRLPVVYIEYSGVYGDPEIVKAAFANAAGARLFYGGGIDTAARRDEMSALAHTVVIGNALYEETDLF
jgi:putative glycerol-1-phosphate prenyltransferase